MKLKVAGLAAAGLLAFASASQAVGVSGQGTWETTLQPRDINGDSVVDAFYDTVLKVTWLADANAGAGSAYDSPGYTTADDGLINWVDANAWVNGLNVYGITGWRLPKVQDMGRFGCDIEKDDSLECGYNVPTISADGSTVFSELAHLYSATLGNPKVPVLANTGPFRNLMADPYPYWAAGRDLFIAPFFNDNWIFYLSQGYQLNEIDRSNEFRVLPVHTGDIAAAVPEPQTYMLWLLGVGALALARRRSGR